ncbi:galactokinase family protein [Paenibacillus sp. FSL K6-2862]|uniref:galactokinase family protein n=1 Tax=Paenibacillus sp. FSL K6-2862 TaxID=2921484 RepID=UPI0030F652A9
MYGQQQLEEQTARYTQLNESFGQYFGVQVGSKLFSAAGHSEIGGNHWIITMVRVLAGSITLDTIAVLR